jgi:hypothetical protein
VLYPDKEAFDALLEKKPGLVMTFGEKLIELAGATQEVAAKKR